MRYLLLPAVIAGLFVPGSSAVGQLRTGPEANKYRFMFYAIDDMAREFRPAEIETIKKNCEATVYADRLGAMYTKRRMILNSFRRHVENIKLDGKLGDAVEEADELMKHVGAYHDKLRAAQNAYDLGFRSIQAKLFTDAELREKMLQSFVDAESYYLSVVDDKNKEKSDYTMRGITRSLKRRAVAEYQISKTRQKLAEDVHAACLRYEAQNRPALEAKINAIHKEFAAGYADKHKAACQAITAKFKPLADKMGVSQAQVYMIAERPEFNWEAAGSDRDKDPFRYIAAARLKTVESAREAKAAHEFARECLKAVELVPSGDPRDTTEVFFYYRGLLTGWAGTLSTRAAAVQLGSEGLDKASPNPVASTAMYAWSCFRPYEKSGAFPRSHMITHTVAAYAYSGKIQEALSYAQKMSGERIDDPDYWYLLARLCGVYKYGSKANIEKYYDQGTKHMREAMLLGFTRVDEARQHPDFNKMRENPTIAARLNNAMFEPDNLYKIAKLDAAARKAD